MFQKEETFSVKIELKQKLGRKTKNPQRRESLWDLGVVRESSKAFALCVCGRYLAAAAATTDGNGES